MAERTQHAGGTGGARRPNIVLILVDDMGFADIGCYGSEIDTPNLDRLARGGMRFTQMYNCARCCPTRASILTGLYPHQAGVGDMVGNDRVPQYQGYLRDDCVTIAEALRPAGYRALMSGKWHVGGPYNTQQPATWTPGDATHPTPVQRGFDEHWGTLCGAGSYYNPPTLIHNDRFIRPEAEDFYLTDAISDNAAEMIARAAGQKSPFFLYVAYTAPHWPLHAPADDVAKYRGRYAKGWDAVRTARHETLRGEGIVDAKWPISPRDEDVPAWADVPDPDYQDALMAAYAAQIDRMDQGIGRIVAKLDQLGIADETLVLFLSDNGGCHEYIRAGSNWAARLAVTTRDGRCVRMGDLPGVMPGPEDTYQSYNRPWANVSNTPFRLFKHWVHEGGIATPLIACWPGHVPAGVITGQLAHVIDVLPTCLDAAGAAYPTQRDDQAVTPAEGISLLPTLTGRRGEVERTIFWEHEGNRAVRCGDWKLVSQAAADGRWELYDMRQDRTELHDLAESNAPMARQLQQRYGAWAERIGVVDWAQIRRGRRS